LIVHWWFKAHVPSKQCVRASTDVGEMGLSKSRKRKLAQIKLAFVTKNYLDIPLRFDVLHTTAGFFTLMVSMCDTGSHVTVYVGSVLGSAGSFALQPTMGQGELRLTRR
jgi:hypothetical protein